ncbi:MAG: transglycosylase SLT domain-containing protein [Actinomycetota bacterium]|nr:transglycosylase SLT domain-containing protein [Actinomycetota bacterium]
MKLTVAVCLALTLATGCGGSAAPSLLQTLSSPSTQAYDPPGPHAKLPGKPRNLSSDLTEVTRALVADIKTRYQTASKPNRRMLLEGLYQQRIYRAMASDTHLGKKVLEHLAGSIKASARSILRAQSALRALVTNPPKHAPDFRLAHPEAPARLERYYKQGERRFGIKWQALASVNFIESKFGRVLGPSSAGAKGPMQFLPSTWERYGAGGDIWDPHDSIIAAARYLHASGGRKDMRGALYAYNNSSAYVMAVLTYMHRMQANKTLYYEFYTWQAFAITKHGDVQLTGPGSKES